MRVAIDLGTTNSLVTMRKNGKTEIIPNQFGKLVTPSVVYSRKNKVYVGELAHQHELEDPANTFRVFKRSMGKSDEFGSDKLNAIDLSSLIIKQLINDAESYTGEVVDEVVVSVPAYFTDSQRQATRQSALRCGVECNRIINEPSAAALAYYAETKQEGMVLVFDFGGGTLDVTVVDIFDNIVDIVSISGDNNLGGHDIDLIINDAVLEQHPELSKISLEQRKVLDKKLEDMKKSLSENEEAKNSINIDGQEYELSITQKDLINRSHSILLKIRGVVSRALTDAGIKSSDIDDVVCVGGSCKSIIIQEYLRELMKQNINIKVNPDEAIVVGLGMMLAIMDREIEYKDIVLTDVCPFSLGVQMINDVYSPIIRRNTTLPTSKTNYYVTVGDNQMYINFSVYQGESVMASVNKLLMSTDIKVNRKPKGEAGAYVTFSYDINGILKVEINGDDVKQEYQNEILTNTLIPKKEIEKAQALIRNLDAQKSMGREELLNARFGRLSYEISASQSQQLQALYLNYQEEKQNLSKGEMILLINKVNSSLDYLEKTADNPFDNPKFESSNNKYN